MRCSVFLTAAVLPTLLILGCAQVAQDNTERITMIAPLYLKGIIDGAVEQFQEENRVAVTVLYEHPDSVISRARTNVMADLFLAGNPRQFESLRKDSLLINGSYACPFRMSMVMVGRADGPSADKIDNLKQDKFRRVVIIDPDAGHEGRLARKVLEKRGLWKKLQSRLIRAHSIEQLHSFLNAKEADAAIMLESSLSDLKGMVVLQRLDKLDKGVDRQLVVCGTVTAHSKSREVAQAFLDLLDSRLCKIYKVGGIYQYQGR
jgi:molybdenum ABC transporter molybdate-binding protein